MSGYDQDVATFDPNGKLFQIQYAQEAPKLGAPVVGIVNDRCAIVVSVRRSPSKLAAYQEKTFKLQQSLGCAVAGIYADARRILKMLRSECQDYVYEHGEQMPIRQLVQNLSDESQQRTQGAGTRLFGVAFLFVGEELGRPALYCTDPSAEYYKFKAHAVGKNAQAVNAFLARHYGEFAGKTPQQLCIKALEGLLQSGMRAEDYKAVEVGVYENGSFTGMKEEDVKAAVESFQQQNPVIEEESDS